MKFREVTLASGQSFQVPQGIQRIDSKSTHGWQVRCQGTKLFSDGESADAQLSLAKATRELAARISAMPAPSGLKQGPSANKTSDLPAGISGPIVRQRAGRAPSAVLSVLLPRFGMSAEVKTVHIASENTYTVEKYLTALAKSTEMRAAAVKRYEQDALQAQHSTIVSLRKQAQALRTHRA
ncbi:MAG: hypothetical protein Q7V20_13560 [Aquabacterium sp.]|uniref:hypothetical protein n=1 Tax=Aquabacterium sp. TaxID=1872578 RepID=UPI0027269941|nr:hypothetical protein [Aquabacterium sp.]MDO9004471.1 hypothetical protein [Aquabacterium sp.]